MGTREGGQEKGEEQDKKREGQRSGRHPEAIPFFHSFIYFKLLYIFNWRIIA